MRFCHSLNCKVWEVFTALLVNIKSSYQSTWHHIPAQSNLSFVIYLHSNLLELKVYVFVLYTQAAEWNHMDGGHTNAQVFLLYAYNCITLQYHLAFINHEEQIWKRWTPLNFGGFCNMYYEIEKWDIRVETEWNRIRIGLNDCACEHSNDPLGSNREGALLTDLVGIRTVLHRVSWTVNSVLQFCHVSANTLPF
jgi:hypothetical protein